MTVISAPRDLYDAARVHLRGRIEQVGFFLADFEPAHALFSLHEWRPMPPEAFEFQSAFHVALRDEARPDIIKWAWDARRCLVEVHSHGDDGIPEFSPSDIWGFSEWVPHVRWRLRGWPYAAIVAAGESFDALAWIDDDNDPSQVEKLEVGNGTCLASAQTLPRLRELREARLGE
jgi:hypothetical protein